MHWQCMLQSIQEMPVHLAITIPGQLAHLSQERISFSHLPLFSTVRQMVFITNTSLHTLSFQWELSSERTAQVSQHWVNSLNRTIAKNPFLPVPHFLLVQLLLYHPRTLYWTKNSVVSCDAMHVPCLHKCIDNACSNLSRKCQYTWPLPSLASSPTCPRKGFPSATSHCSLQWGKWFSSPTHPYTRFLSSGNSALREQLK